MITLSNSSCLRMLAPMPMLSNISRTAMLRLRQLVRASVRRKYAICKLPKAYDTSSIPVPVQARSYQLQLHSDHNGHSNVIIYAKTSFFFAPRRTPETRLHKHGSASSKRLAKSSQGFIFRQTCSDGAEVSIAVLPGCATSALCSMSISLLPH